MTSPLAIMETGGKPPPSHVHATSFWLWVMCLTGVDYFSTLGYQPSIAFNAAGMLSPIATLVLVLVTLFGALPVYRHVAERSPHGQGSIAMLEALMTGWTGKIAVLTLVGFAATDFVITKTLSAADAAEHLLHNPFWMSAPVWLHDQMLITMFLLVLLGAMFLRGFSEVIGLATVLVGLYLTLNLILLFEGLRYLAVHPHLLAHWAHQVATGEWYIDSPPLLAGRHEWWAIALVSVVIFPKLALGLSGFETGVAVMSLVKGDPDDTEENPRGRIRNTQRLLVTAALIMCAFLLGSSLMTATLIDPDALAEWKGPEPKPTPETGEAANRALAYLAHGNRARGLEPISPLFGEAFGTVYDISTIVILWFAGASAMAGLLNLVPKYPPRYGMAPEWAQAVRPLVVLFTVVNLFVTWMFNASVEDQGGAYATGVLVLISSACSATVIDLWRERTGSPLWRKPWAYVLIAVVFWYTTVLVVIEKPEGMRIALCFIAAILAVSMASRMRRSKELRFGGFQFIDERSHFLWDSMRVLELPVLVPHRPGTSSLAEKEASIRSIHRLTPDVPVVFIEASLGDASDFYQRPMLEIRSETEERMVLIATRCTAIPQVLATIALELAKGGKPPELHFGWSDESPLAASVSFVLFGQGNVPWMVRELIRRNEPDAKRRPRVVVG